MSIVAEAIRRDHEWQARRLQALFKTDVYALSVFDVMESLGLRMEEAAQAEAHRDFQKALRLAGRNLGPELLWAWYFELGLRPDELRSLVPDVWEMADFAEEQLGQSPG